MNYGYSSHTMYSPGMDADFIDHLLVRPHTSWRGTRGVRVNFGAEDADGMESDFEGDLEDDLEDEDLDDDYGILGIALTKAAKERKALRKKGRKVREHIEENVADRPTDGLQERLRRLKEAMATPGRIVTVHRREGGTSRLLRKDAKKRIRMIQLELSKRGESFGEDEDEYGRLYASSGHFMPEEASPGDMGSILGRSGSSGFRGARPTFGAKLEVLGVGSYEGHELGVFALSLGALALVGKALKVF